MANLSGTEWAPKDLLPVMRSWPTINPDHEYTVFDHAATSHLDVLLKGRPHIRQVMDSATPLILRADILRYVLLAQYGGVYSDVDVTALKPISRWIPARYRHRTQVVVGIEYDQLDWEGRWPGITYSVQLCQWTVMAVSNHELLWRAADEAAYAVLDLMDEQMHDLSALNITGKDVVMRTTGPVLWTKVVLDYLRMHYSADLHYRDLSGLTEPSLLHDVLILPIDAFGTGQPHSSSNRQGSPEALARHLFRGSWKADVHT